MYGLITTDEGGVFGSYGVENVKRYYKLAERCARYDLVAHTGLPETREESAPIIEGRSMTFDPTNNVCLLARNGSKLV